MIKKLIVFLSFFALVSCSNIQLVLKDTSLTNDLKDNVFLVFNKNNKQSFERELISFFGNNKGGDFIIISSFYEKKENRLVKKNQVAEKIDYYLSVDYELYYLTQDCKIFEKKIVSKFSFVPKSFGYNFGADRSLEKQYKASLRKNIQNFTDRIPKEKNCL